MPVEVQEEPKTLKTTVGVGEPVWLTEYDRKGEHSISAFATREAALVDVCWYVLDFIECGRLDLEDECWAEFIQLCDEGKLDEAYLLWDTAMEEELTHEIFLYITENPLGCEPPEGSISEKAAAARAKLKGEVIDPAADTIVPEAAPTTEVDVDPEG